MQLKISILSSIFMVASCTQSVAAFTAPAFIASSAGSASSIAALSRPSALRMALIDNDSFPRDPKNERSLSDGTYPKQMGVSNVFARDLPEDIEEKVMSMIFSFDEGSKVKKHSHIGSGSYFVTSGSLKVTTNTESKTYEKGDFVIVPKDEEYALEEVGGGAEVFYIYWKPECPAWRPYGL